MSSIRIDVRGVEELIASLGAKRRAVRFMLRDAGKDIAEHFKGELVELAPRQTGNLQNAAYVHSPKFRHIGTASEWWIEAGIDEVKAPYAIFVEKGTGVYGPTGMPIEPKPGNVLHFMLGGVPTWATHTRGQPGQYYFRNAWLRTRYRYVPVKLYELKKELEAL